MKSSLTSSIASFVSVGICALIFLPFVAQAQGYPAYRQTPDPVYHQTPDRSYPVRPAPPVRYQPRPYPVYYPQPVYYQQPTYYPEPEYYPTPVYYPSYYQSYAPLAVSCGPSVSNGYINTSVTWNAYVSGGSGYDTFSWYGTDNPVSYDSSSIFVAYQGPGPKDMTVTVWSGDGQTASADCGLVNVSPGYYDGAYPSAYPPYQY